MSKNDISKICEGNAARALLRGEINDIKCLNWKQRKVPKSVI